MRLIAWCRGHTKIDTTSLNTYSTHTSHSIFIKTPLLHNNPLYYTLTPQSTRTTLLTQRQNPLPGLVLLNVTREQQALMRFFCCWLSATLRYGGWVGLPFGVGRVLL